MCSLCPAHAALSPPSIEQLAALLPERPGQPGVSAAVIVEGRVVAQRATGLADMVADQPFTMRTRSNLGSTSKQFTALAVQMLAAEGRLSLDDEVRRHLPELPQFDRPVTLRHLLHHTSGYREIYQALQLAGRRPFEDHVDRAEVLRVVQRQPSLQSEPGRVWDYNNTGYALLAMVVERVTGQPFKTWLQQQVFAPLGMSETQVRSSPDEPMPRSARGYTGRQGAYREARDLGAAVGASAIYATPRDLALWMANFESGRVGGGPGLLARMLTGAVSTGRGEQRYGLGLYTDVWRGQARVFHDGDDTAHHSAFLYFPEHKLGVVVHTNDASFSAAGLAQKLAEVCLAEALAANKAQAPAATLPLPEPALLDRVSGSYASSTSPGLVYRFSRAGTALNVEVAGERMGLVYQGAQRFTVKGQSVSVDFELPDDQSGAALAATVSHQVTDRALRTAADAMATPLVRPELSSYTGRFDSPELQTTYQLGWGAQGLVLTHPLFPSPIALRHLAGERYGGADPVSSVVFERDATGQVVALRVGNGAGREYVRFLRSASAPISLESTR